MTRIAITGALGRMGTLVIQEAARIEGMELVAGLDAVGAGDDERQAAAHAANSRRTVSGASSSNRRASAAAASS